MIRYISEKEVNLTPSRRLKNTHSLQKSLELERHIIQVPQEIHTSSQALKNLKKINDQSILLKSRLSVLQIQEQKNDFRAFLNEQRYKFHQDMQDQMERQRHLKARHLKKITQKLYQNKQQVKTNRLQHQLNLKKAHERLLNSKNNDYKTTKSLEKEIEESVIHFQIEQGEKNKQRNLSIREYERNQRLNVHQYFQHKKKEQQKNDLQQSLKLSRIRQEKKEQIEQLSHLEALMIQRQARSKMSSKQSEGRLKNLISNKQAVSTAHTTKLPLIANDKRQNSEQDILIL